VVKKTAAAIICYSPGAQAGKEQKICQADTLLTGHDQESKIGEVSDLLHKRKSPGTFDSMDDAKKHEREIQYFKHH
jgi:hypothetical protein